LFQQNQKAPAGMVGASIEKPYKSKAAEGQSQLGPGNDSRAALHDSRLSTLSQNSAWTPDSWHW
jgi:hypothetical protein